MTAAGDPLDDPGAGDRVIRGGAARTVAYVAGILVGLVATPLMVRHLGLDDFGAFVTVNSLLFIAAGLTEAGLGAVGVREYATRDDAGRRRLVRDLFGLRLALTALGTLGALGWGLAAGYDGVLLLGIGLSGLALLFANLQGVFVVPLTVWLRFGWLAALDLQRQVVTAAVIVVLVVAGASLLPFFAAQVVANVIAFGIAFLLVRRRVPTRPRVDLGEWRALLSDSLPYAAAVAASVLYFRVAILLMSVLAAGETGVYALAFRIVEIVSGVPWLLVATAFPILTVAARDDADRLRYAIGRVGEVSLILGVWVAIAVGFGAPFAVEVVAGDQEDAGAAVPVLAVLGVAMIGTFFVASFGHGLLALRRHRTILAANVAALVLGTALATLLVVLAGAIGAAIATAVTEVLLGLLYLVLLVRARPDLRPDARVLRPVALAAAAAIAVPLVLGLPSVPATVLASLLFFAVLAALRAIPPEVGQALRRRPVGPVVP